jgi:hypothetical protein
VLDFAGEKAPNTKSEIIPGPRRAPCFSPIRAALPLEVDDSGTDLNGDNAAILLAVVRREVRRAVVLRRFPFVIRFLVEAKRIVILSVFPTRGDAEQLPSNPPKLAFYFN